jgi:hypothetical protein
MRQATHDDASNKVPVRSTPRRAARQLERLAHNMHLAVAGP